MDFLLASLALELQREGSRELSLGFCAFQGVKGQGWWGYVLGLLQRASWFYNSEGLYNFKKKYSDQEHVRYLMFDPQYPMWKQILALFRVTYGYSCSVPGTCSRGNNGEPFTTSAP
jgi:lysylphosphatidylglycerol synthetase-like protein (DUF2156 family)